MTTTRTRSRFIRLGAALATAALLAAFALVLVQAQVRAQRELEERFALRTAIGASFVSSWIDDFARQEADDAAATLSAAAPQRRDFELFVETHDLPAAVLLDGRGRVLHVWPRSPDLLGTDLAGKYPHLAAAVAGRVGVSNVVPSAVEGTPIVAVAAPFETPYGDRVVSGGFAVSEMPIGQTYLENVTPIEGARVYLVDAAGEPLSSNRATPQEVDPRDRALLAAIPTSTDDTTRFGDDIASIEPIAGTPWRLVVAVPSRSLFEPIGGWSLWGPWITFAALVIAVGAGWWLFEKLGRSRAALASANAELIAHGTRLAEGAAAQRRFMSSASHELRTPLTSIIGYIELVRDAEDDDERLRALEVVERNANRLYALVDSLMTVFRSEVETFATDHVELYSVVAESVEAALPEATSRQIELQLRGQPPAPVLGDRQRLAQVVDNIVSNAIKYSPEGGRVGVGVETDPSTVRVEIADQGIGIPEDELERMFERFFRARTARSARIGGTGLGLAITHAIVEKHGGHIRVESSEGEGTTFVVELPHARGGPS